MGIRPGRPPEPSPEPELLTGDQAALRRVAEQARADVQRLADEQSALRAVAELVAQSAPAEAIFAAVTLEASQLFNGTPMTLTRFGRDHDLVVLATHGGPAPIGTRIAYQPGTLPDQVRLAGQLVRVDDYSRELDAELAAEFGLAAAVSVPISVAGEVWGMLTATSDSGPLTAGVEQRLLQFTGLVTAALANIQSRSELQSLADERAALRRVAELVARGADETRRRIQRDVHDSAQQRLVHTIIALKLARDAIAAGHSGADFVEEALANAQRANRDLRDVVRGILPAALTRGGLRTGLESLIADFSLPIHLQATVPRLPTRLETTAYFIVAEALTNVVKHAHATHATVTIAIKDDNLDIQIADDGTGGADPDHGSGLTGLQDRVEASTGTLVVTSPPGNGTALHATLPVELPPGHR